MERLKIATQFVKFLIAQKKYWLVPIAIILLLLSALLVAGQGSVLAPFIYTLF